MNRLNRLMAMSWWNARTIWLDYDDGLAQHAEAYWMREFRIYHALCRCIRRGYKPVREATEDEHFTNFFKTQGDWKS